MERIRKFVSRGAPRENKEHTENRQRIQLQRPLLSPVDRQGEQANCIYRNIFQYTFYVPIEIKHPMISYVIWLCVWMCPCVHSCMYPSKNKIKQIKKNKIGMLGCL